MYSVKEGWSGAFVGERRTADEVFYQGDYAKGVTVREGGARRSLDPRHDLCQHPRTEFTWGNRAEAANQLSLALLADALQNDTRALRLHHKFTSRVVTIFPDRWTISRSRIRAHADTIEQNQAD